ncbi:MAG: class I SAM-dependent methyltransferase [Candidatus Competibacteraceae bacterium]|nr:class I SAM-dependent methyltransferase [Candidatus Competibacteraceae bacterium]
MEKHKTTQQLRGAIMSMPEFKEANRQHLRASSLGGFEPRTNVEAVLSEDKLVPLFEHIQSVWQKLGETEPYWSVLVQERFKQANISDPEDFYKTGKNDLLRIQATLQRVGLDPQFPKSCLEYGCGLGRATRWLADAYQEVHGVDISAAHLAQAKNYFDTTNISNVTFHHMTKLGDLDALPRVDLIYTAIVLQHNPPPVIVHTLRRLLRALNPGGVAIFHLPTYRDKYSFVLEDYMEKAKGETKMEMHAVPQQVIFQLISDEGAICLEALEDERGRIPNRPSLSNLFVVQKL